MDREINPTILKLALARRAAIVIGLIIIGYLSVNWGFGLLKPTISRARIRTAKVEYGSIESTINASGIVVPEFEQVISSPINARVVKILKQTGAIIKRGDAIVELDASESSLALEKLEQQLALKQNQQQKVKLDLESTLINLKSQAELKSLDHKSFQNTLTRDQMLYQKGLLSAELLHQAELAVEKVTLELKQLNESQQNARLNTETQLAGLELEIKTLTKERDEAEHQLALATARSDRDGVLTWVVTEEGATLSKGAVLARIADLNSFRVEATVSDIHAGQLSAGLPVSIKINDDYLAGDINNVQPTIKDGVITLVIELQNRADARLRANLRVDVLVVTEHKDRVLRIQKGPFINSGGQKDVFVLRGDVAVKTPAQIGMASFDHYEVTSGLLAGDEVIISDTTEFQHLREIRLKN